MAYMEGNYMKQKIKKIAEKIGGGVLIIVGMIIGYQGVKMISKKDYARGYINLSEED